MARTYLVFGDIDGKLDVLRVECARCQRKGRYSVRRLIEKYGRNANMMKWKEQLNGEHGLASFLSKKSQQGISGLFSTASTQLGHTA